MDGTKLVAAPYGGGIYTSTNSGSTWISNNVPTRNWYCVASSADGAKLVAGIATASDVGNGGIYTNGGITWSLTSAPAYSQTWITIASSTDGTKLVAAGSYIVTGINPPIYHEVYTSADSGKTWTLANLPNLKWFSVASSADGTKLVALASGTNVFYSSSNSGTTWVSNTIPNNLWYCIASSADGTKLTAVAHTGTGGDGLIYTSTNSGATWNPGNVPSQNWYSVASSSDGTKLVACGFYSTGSIYTSTDSGQTWISNNVPNYPWVSVASSADGSRLVAVAASGQIYSAQPTSPLLSGKLSGTNFTLAWPAAATSFQLQQNSTLITNGWTTVTNSVVIINGQNQVIVPATNKQTFYRLISQ